MKYKTTRKAILNGSPRLVCAGYCDLSFLLRDHDPVAYTSGVYGWNFDVYEVYGLTICTGYRGMPGRRANNIGVYEQAARELAENRALTYEQRKERRERLLREFCEQA